MPYLEIPSGVLIVPLTLETQRSIRAAIHSDRHSRLFRELRKYPYNLVTSAECDFFDLREVPEWIEGRMMNLLPAAFKFGQIPSAFEEYFQNVIPNDLKTSDL
jgi:hypothetical protein